MIRVVPTVAEVPVIHTNPVPRVSTNRRRLHRRPPTRLKRFSAFVRWQWTTSQIWNSIRRLKTVRERREVSRWAMPFPIFAAGVVLGVLIASPGNRSNGGLEDRGADPVGSARATLEDGGVKERGADPVGSARATLEDGGVKERGADPVGSASATLPGAVGTALVAPPLTARSPGHRGTLIVRSQPVGASVYVNNRLAGRTPLVMNAVPAGSRAVRLSLDGYAAWSRGVSVVANQSTAITAKLETIR
ncbi:MAG: PEGA domain-containing protein [Vicinamibacterales bacterium]